MPTIQTFSFASVSSSELCRRRHVRRVGIGRDIQPAVYELEAFLPQSSSINNRNTDLPQPHPPLLVRCSCLCQDSILIVGILISRLVKHFQPLAVFR